MTPVAFFELVLALVAATLVLSLVAGRLHVPPAAALVLGGMALALTPGIPAVTLDPDLILVLFLPPLLMSSAYFTVWRDFKRFLQPILQLALGAVVFTTLVVGAVAHLFVPALPWAACFALGAIVSPPDAVAAKAVLERLSLPRPLATILEGESLVNDASGLVLYRFAVVAALTGTFSLPHALGSFAWLAVGGVAIGLGFGVGVIWIMRRMKDAHAVIVTTFLTAWAAYLVAERLEASGVLAVVACGLLFGSREHSVIGAHVRVQAGAVWSIVVFVLEALVFVLIGLALRGVLHRNGGDMAALGSGLPMAIAVAVAVIVARVAWIAFVVYGGRFLAMLLGFKLPLPPATQIVVLAWAGMRGVVTLAVALALPMNFPGRDAILLAAFVVILVTVLVQGTTLGPLIVALRLDARREVGSAELLNAVDARIAVNEAALHALEALTHEDNAEVLHPRLVEEYRRRVRATTRFRDEREAIEMERRDHFAAALLAVATARGELIRLHRERKIHDSVLRSIESDLDLEELRLNRLAGAVVE